MKKLVRKTTKKTRNNKQKVFFFSRFMIHFAKSFLSDAKKELDKGLKGEAKKSAQQVSSHAAS